MLLTRFYSFCLQLMPNTVFRLFIDCKNTFITCQKRNQSFKSTLITISICNRITLHNLVKTYSSPGLVPTLDELNTLESTYINVEYYAFTMAYNKVPENILQGCQKFLLASKFLATSYWIKISKIYLKPS